MTNESSDPKESAIVEVSPQTKEMVEKNMPDASEEIKNETMELIDAIKKRAQAEANTAGELTREAYLEAVKNAEAIITSNETLAQQFQEELSKAISMIEEEATQNWEALTKEVESFGERLSQAAETAWKILTEPESKEQ